MKEFSELFSIENLARVFSLVRENPTSITLFL